MGEFSGVTTEAPTRSARILAYTAITLALLFLLWGVLAYGLSWETQARLWSDVFDRPGGPMSFRFILQPTMATIAALHDGIADARSGRRPYLRTMLTDATARGGRVMEGLYAISRIILLGFAMDAIYQWKVLGTFYPAEAVVITLILAVVPYVVLRGPIARFVRWWFARHPKTQSQG
jgi:hypothetical protein